MDRNLDHLDPRIRPLHDVGCRCCDFPSETVVCHPRTGEVVDRIPNDVCDVALMLRLRAGMALSRANRSHGNVRGLWLHRLAGLEADYFRHTYDGSPA